MNATLHSKSRLIHSLSTYFTFSWGLLLCGSRKTVQCHFFHILSSVSEIKVDLIVFWRQWPFRGILLCYHLEVSGLYETVQILSHVHPLCCVFFTVPFHVLYDLWDVMDGKKLTDQREQCKGRFHRKRAVCTQIRDVFHYSGSVFWHTGSGGMLRGGFHAPYNEQCSVKATYLKFWWFRIRFFPINWRIKCSSVGEEIILLLKLNAARWLYGSFAS